MKRKGKEFWSDYGLENLSEEGIMDLAKGMCPAVRMNIAMSDYTSEKILKYLSHDENDEVKGIGTTFIERNVKKRGEK
jgi:hypothetical protein